MAWRYSLLLPAAGAAASVLAGAPAGAADEPAHTQRFALFGQATYTEQQSDNFDSPYRGTNSLTPDSGRETVDVTLFLGARIWSGAELWVNGEIDQGFGLDNTTGAAGFPSAEAYKVGNNHPYFRLPRLFIRQTIDLGAPGSPQEAAQNQFAGAPSEDRLVLTMGKFGVVDVFDTSKYAHDPRRDFLNWALVDTGTYDYAADAWAYTVGASIEWYTGAWTLRFGAFDLSDVPNSPHLEPGFDEFQLDWEVEHRHTLFGLPGRVLFTGFLSRGRMGLLDEAVELAEESGQPVDIAAVRTYRGRLGGGLSVEQQLFRDGGMFLRLGKAQGNVESYEFTDIDRTVAVGGSSNGTSWGRPHDTVGLALVGNGISAERERYLAAGGLGLLVGDGRLPHPGPEQILETYYQARLLPPMWVALDFQHIRNPGYNRDRGPVSVWAVRVHLEF